MPENGDPQYALWDRCNTLVLSWINHTLHPSIAQSVLRIKTAEEVWKDLKDRNYPGDIFQISELEEEIYLKQGEQSISKTI